MEQDTTQAGVARRSWLATLVCGLLGVCSAACDVGSAGLRSADAGAGWVVDTVPASGDRDVSRRPRIRAKLDRRVLPRSVHGGTVRLESGAVAVRLVMHFEPVTRELVLEPATDAAPLRPRTAYRLRLRDLVDLDGHRQPDEYTAVFHTGEAVDPPAPQEHAGWKQARGLFARHCVDGPCHDAGHAAAGLDLSSGESVAATALNVPSAQFPRGTVDVGGAPGARVLAALPIIDVLAGSGTPASSYLLYKALADPHIVGEPMPPPRNGMSGGLSEQAARTLSSWILAGAPTD